MFTVMIVFSSSVVCIFHGQLKSSTTNNSWVGYCHHCTADVSLCRLQHSGKEKLLLCNNEGGGGREPHLQKSVNVQDAHRNWGQTKKLQNLVWHTY